MTLDFLNSASFRILLSKIMSGDIKGYTAAMTLADSEVLQERDEQGRMLLHHAALANQDKIIADLLGRGASKDATDNARLTPYMLADQRNCGKAKKLLAPAKVAAEADTTHAAIAPDGQPVQKREPKTLRLPVKSGASFQGKPVIA